MERVIGDFGETADLQQVCRLQEVAQLLLTDVNFAVVHKPKQMTAAEKNTTFIIIIKKYLSTHC